MSNEKWFCDCCGKQITVKDSYAVSSLPIDIIGSANQGESAILCEECHNNIIKGETMFKPITVRELQNALKGCIPSAVVCLSQDEEGNGYRFLMQVDKDIPINDLEPFDCYHEEVIKNLKTKEAIVLW